ncbi:hypothetical protein EYF80_042824 [Liparis tanakae]|uniref:Uncharacterized protein n=1 Tax=Liparis tanakae TaxID=230148 RepID=A0A4Z2G1I7_9TELE|nr:hypothetical protein EYF80_042824 [Liparis tanakae]
MGGGGGRLINDTSAVHIRRRKKEMKGKADAAEMTELRREKAGVDLHRSPPPTPLRPLDPVPPWSPYTPTRLL